MTIVSNQIDKGTMTVLSDKDIGFIAQRRRNPTILSVRNCDSIAMTKRTAASRRKETMSACLKIHGCGNNAAAAKSGMWSTFVNSCSMNELRKYLSDSKKVQQALGKDKPSRGEKGSYVQSMKVLYQGGLLSKRKYQSIRNSMKTSSTNILPYKMLMDKVRSTTMCPAKECPDISGCRRELEALLISVTGMYLELDAALPEKNLWHWYENSPGVVHYALAADGAPFGRSECATSLLLSIVNLQHAISSCDHHYLVVGGNCKENYSSFLNHCVEVYNEAEAIEAKTYCIAGYDVCFRLSLVPADMKWVAIASGELSNAATYPCSFANVRQEHLQGRGINGLVGNFANARWKPWAYERRLVMVEKVDTFKSREKKLTRQKVTSFIAKCESRQEYKPVIGKYVGVAYVEPLHLKNNAFQHLHELLFAEVMDRTPAPIRNKASTVHELPRDCALAKYLHALVHKVGAGRLHMKIAKWYMENKSSKEAHIRFTGEESMKYSHHFMHLITAVMGVQESDDECFRLHQLAYCYLQLRDVVQLMSRVYVTIHDIQALRESCRVYFNCCALFLKCTLSIWCIGKVVPFHAQEIFRVFGLGLGLNTAQGREAKHLSLREYINHSTWNNRWVMAFRHEEMHLLWLRKADPHGFGTPVGATHHKTKECNKYIPTKYLESKEICFCGLSKSTEAPCCKFCSHPLRHLIHTSCLMGSVYGDLRQHKKKSK